MPFDAVPVSPSCLWALKLDSSQRAFGGDLMIPAAIATFAPFDGAALGHLVIDPAPPKEPLQTGAVRPDELGSRVRA